MQERHLFEYAVIRIVPRVERGEFVNTGVILYCAKKKFLGMKYNINEKKLHCFGTEIDLDEVKEYLNAFEKVSLGGKNTGPIGRLPYAERFRWLTAKRSSIVQVSEVHPGLCADPQARLELLFEEMVG